MRKAFLMSKLLARTAAWALLGVITVLSLVPPQVRPLTGAPSNYEHLGIFLIVGALFAAGYQMKIQLFFALAIAYSAAIEILQNFSPGRHARLSDFFIDSASACLGIAVVMLFQRHRRSRA
jgi:VanZ family protein